MSTSTRVSIGAFVIALVVTLSLFLPLLNAEEPIAPDQQKKAQDAAAATPEVKPKEAKRPVEVTDAARPVLDKMRDAYAKLAGLQAGGAWTTEWDIDGETGNQSANFASSFAAPNKFRYEVKDDLLFGSTGEKVYAFRKNQYLMGDAPKSRVAVADLPRQFADFLKEKDPALLLAATSEDTPYLAEQATKIDKGEDVKIGDAAFTALKVSTENGANVSVLVDPATGLMRRWSVDLKKSLEERGQQGVNKATMTIEYDSVKPEAPGDAEAFALAPPAGAKDAAKMAAAGDGEASDLEGKPAPAFELTDLEGKTVKLADLKGSVVVLDFWATWCGPCRKGLPILDTVTQARKDKKELKVFAVNLEEDKAAVADFVKESKLGLTVLLDSTGDTGRAYGANAIPMTVIIGKDGVVKKASVGVHPQLELEQSIDEALKG